MKATEHLYKEVNRNYTHEPIGIHPLPDLFSKERIENSTTGNIRVRTSTPSLYDDVRYICALINHTHNEVKLNEW